MKSYFIQLKKKLKNILKLEIVLNKNYLILKYLY